MIFTKRNEESSSIHRRQNVQKCSSPPPPISVGGFCRDEKAIETK